MSEHATTLFPAIEPYDRGLLEVSDIHTLYWETCGRADATPVLVLHGGPGGSIKSYYRQLLDPT
ncbi:MAG: hypothetical protein V2J89_13350, partial [Halieaceae bacterium]|nr:hypothetical protein [Halieaceae bacterium]